MILPIDQAFGFAHEVIRAVQQGRVAGLSEIDVAALLPKPAEPVIEPVAVAAKPKDDDGKRGHHSDLK